MTTHRGRISWLAILVTFLTVIGGSSAQRPRRNPYIDVQLSGPVRITQQWLELTPKKPLKVQRDWQEITLFPSPPIKTKDGNGPEFEIETELIDSEGRTYRPTPGLSETLTGNLTIVTRSLDFKDLPPDATFTKVRIKSNPPYPVKKILWRCYNWAEVNH